MVVVESAIVVGASGGIQSTLRRLWGGRGRKSLLDKDIVKMNVQRDIKRLLIIIGRAI